MKTHTIQSSISFTAGDIERVEELVALAKKTRGKWVSRSDVIRLAIKNELKRLKQEA